MVQVIQERGKFESLGEFGTLLGSVLQQQNARKQQAQAQQNFQNLLPTLDPNKQLSLQDTLRIQQMAQQAGYDPKAVMDAIKTTKPSNLERILAGSEYQNQEMDINPFEAPVSASAKPLVEATYQNLAPRPVSPIENLSDRQILALSSSPNPEDRAFADMAIKQKEARRKEFIDNRDYHSKVSDKFAQKMSDLQSGVSNIDIAINEYQMGIESGAGGTYSPDYFAGLFGEWGAGLVTPGGVLQNNATKKFLLADLEKVSAKGTNMFLEQRLTSTYGQLGRKKETNDAWIETAKMKNDIDKAKLKAYKEISQNYEQKLGYVPRNIEYLVDEATKDEVKQISDQAAINVQKIFESEKTDKDLLKDINKKVFKDTPLTERNAQIFLNKFGKDAEKRALERGYRITLPDGTPIFKTLVRGDSPSPKEGEITNSEIIKQFGLEKKSIPQDIKLIDKNKDIDVDIEEDIDLPQIVKGVGQGAADIALQAGMGPSLIQSLASLGLSPEARAEVATPGQRAQAKRLIEPTSEAEFIRRASEEEDILPPVYTPGARSLLEETLSAPRGTIGEESIRRATRNLPYLAGGPGLYSATAGRDIAGQFAAEGAKTLGFGETGQTIADIAAGFIPGKSFVPQKQDQSLLKDLFNKGFTEQEAALLLRKDKGIGRAFEAGSKKSRFTDILEGIYKKSGEAYDFIKQSKPVNSPISKDAHKKIIQTVEEKLKSFPVQSEEAIRKDYNKFINTKKGGEKKLGQVTGSDLIDFYKAIGKQSGSEKILSILKPVITNELRKIDPQSAKDFTLVNDVYSRYKKISDRLKITEGDKTFDAMKKYGMLGALVSIPFSGLKAITGMIGIEATRELLTALVKNPRYQNLFTKTVASFNSGNIKGIEKLSKEILLELSKDAPDAYEQLMLEQDELQL